MMINVEKIIEQVLRKAKIWKVSLFLLCVLLAGCATQVHITLGNKKFAKNDFDSAISEFKNVLKDEPDNKTAISMLGWCYFKKGNYELAIKNFKEYQKVYPDDPEALNAIGWCYFKTGDFKKAKISFNNSIKLNEKQSEPYNGLGYIYSAEGDIVVSFNNFQKALTVNIDDPEAHRGLGYLYYSKGEFDNSITEMKRSLRIQPEWSDCLLVIAKSHLAKKEYENAENYFEDYLQEKKYNDLDIAIQFASMKFYKKDYSKVIKYLGWLQDIKIEKQKEWSNYGSGLSLFGWSYFYKKDYKKSLEIFKLLSDLHKESDYYADIHDGLAWNYLKLNNLDSAFNEFQIALKLAPEYSSSLTGLAELEKIKKKIDKSQNK